MLPSTGGSTELSIGLVAFGCFARIPKLIDTEILRHECVPS